MAFDQQGEVEGARWFTTKGENDLDRLILGSEIMESEFVDQEKLKKLLESVKWVGTGYEFLYLVSKSKSEGFVPQNPVVLGLSSSYEVPQAMSRHAEGTTWGPLYRKYGISQVGDPRHLEKFLPKLLKDPEVKSIIFVVPPEMYTFKKTHGYGNEWTKKEFEYMLNHPELCGKVYFVFGAYEMVDKQGFNAEVGTMHGDIPSMMEDLKREVDLVLTKDFQKFVESLGQ